MKTRRLKKLLGTLALDGAACLVVRGDRAGDLAGALARLRPQLALPRSLPILVLAPGASVEAMDEAEMRRAGWVRA